MIHMGKSMEGRGTCLNTPEETIELAEAAGLVCIWPEDFELQIDLDIPYYDRNNIGYSTNKLEAVMQSNGITIMGVLDTESKSGNTHRYMWISEPVSYAEAIAIQACLRSDPVRELLSLIRLRNVKTPMALFELPENAELVYRWRAEREAEYERTHGS